MRLLKTTLALILCLALATPALWAAAEPPFSQEYENKIGREAAAQVESEYERYEDEEALAKVNEMVAAIATSSTRTDVTYDVRLLDTEMANAFSLPGGIIYVTKGLLETVQSDHELAGILAHEIAHNCTYDALKQAERNQDLFTGSVAAAIAAILMGADSEVISTVFMAGEYVRRGVLGGYSIEMEAAADRHAVEYMAQTDYNPVGLLTFMERLAADYRREPHADMGVFQTHPLAPERVAALAKQISDLGLEINHRATTEWERPKAQQIEEEASSPVAVTLWGEEIFRVSVAGPEHETAMDRAEAITSRLTELLTAGLSGYELHIGDRDGHPAVGARGTIILTVYPEDADGREQDPDELAQQALTALQRALFKERLDRLY